MPTLDKWSQRGTIFSVTKQRVRDKSNDKQVILIRTPISISTPKLYVPVPSSTCIYMYRILVS